MDSISFSLLNEIITASNILVTKTKPTDHLIFVGQSPDYLTYLVGTCRKISRIPMSGRVYCDQWNIPPTEKLKKYFELLDTFEMNHENIVLIDHSHSGKSISGFSKLLNRYFGFICKDNAQWNYNINSYVFPFINLISPGQKNGWIRKPDPAFISTRGFIIMPSLVDLANSKYPRTIKNFQFNNWDKFDNNELTYEQNHQILCNKIQAHLDRSQYTSDYMVRFSTYVDFGEPI